MNSLPKTVTRQRRGCDLNPGPSAPESSTLTTRLPYGETFRTMGLDSSILKPEGQNHCLMDTLVLVSKCPDTSDPSEQCRSVSVSNCLGSDVSGSKGVRSILVRGGGQCPLAS